MAHVTRIKAHDPAKPKDTPSAEPPKPEPKDKPKSKPEPTAKLNKKELKKPFILFRPFVAFGRYLRDSWRELRQVRWPNRKTTWKMVLAVFIYTIIIIAFLTALGVLFDWLFNLILN